MPIKDDIVGVLTKSMKAGDAAKVSVLRMLLSAIKNVEIEKRAALDDAAVVEVIKRQVKQLRDALIDFEKGGRQDLVQQNKAEIDLMSAYLPAELSDEELQAKVEQIVGGLGDKSTLNVGKAVGAVMKELKGQVSGDRVKEVVTKILSS
jgi:hypothetical protein